MSGGQFLLVPRQPTTENTSDERLEIYKTPKFPRISYNEMFSNDHYSKSKEENF